ncbi:uncharacterized protein L3040_004084 [Drepanopeziza brunnea f. sp. 'multigermtubi']|uniref:uncharacterized protein n=1 Tax=Drepanopeziza brunnea f. sp. 'multigermtubi' TaxID=698441 RepID=UPI00238553A2|nr:hypothetical protein L3040_004084 [Drepanopeziza brunnea f. sp. 'multigermtubi']
MEIESRTQTILYGFQSVGNQKLLSNTAEIITLVQFSSSSILCLLMEMNRDLGQSSTRLPISRQSKTSFQHRRDHHPLAVLFSILWLQDGNESRTRTILYAASNQSEIKNFFPTPPRSSPSCSSLLSPSCGYKMDIESENSERATTCVFNSASVSWQPKTKDPSLIPAWPAAGLHSTGLHSLGSSLLAPSCGYKMDTESRTQTLFNATPVS